MDEKKSYSYHNGEPAGNNSGTSGSGNGFFSSNQSRMKYYETGEGVNAISRSKYNAIIGGLLLYGFLVNILMIYFLSEPILVLASESMLMFLLIYIGMVIAGTVCIRSKSNIVNFIGYNLIVIPLGLVVSVLVTAYASIDPSIVSYALIITAGVTVVMIAAGLIMQDFFLSMGRVLFTGLIAAVILQLVVGFIFRIDSTVLDYAIVILFMGYIGFDWARAQKVPPTLSNAIRSACDLYMDIINIFIRIMSILGRNSKNN